jgi:hypothetical protein
MLKKLLPLVATLLIACPVWAADDVDTATSDVGGTILELAQIVVGGTGAASLLDLTQDGTGETAYDAGFVASAADAIQLTLDANKQWQLSAVVNTWTDPVGYDKAESDMQIQITNTPTGTIQNSADSYVGLSTSDLVILNHTAGVSDDQVDVQARVLLDWTQDIPGVYSITITWTMETTP